MRCLAVFSTVFTACGSDFLATRVLSGNAPSALAFNFFRKRPSTTLAGWSTVAPHCEFCDRFGPCVGGGISAACSCLARMVDVRCSNSCFLDCRPLFCAENHCARGEYAFLCLRPREIGHLVHSAPFTFDLWGVGCGFPRFVSVGIRSVDTSSE